MAVLRLRRRWWRRRATSAACREFLSAPYPSPRSDWRCARFLALDIESTGLDPRRDQIISVGWVALEAGEILLGQAAHHLVRGESGVGQSAAIHLITDSARARGATLDSVLEALFQAAAGRVIVAHHAPVERGFLDAACRRVYGVPFIAPVIDTLALERRRFALRGGHPGSGELRLGACRRRYGLPDYPLHDALGDALAAGELMLAQAAHIIGNERLSIGALMAMSQ